MRSWLRGAVSDAEWSAVFADESLFMITSRIFEKKLFSASLVTVFQCFGALIQFSSKTSSKTLNVAF